MAIYTDYVDVFNLSENGNLTTDYGFHGDESMWQHVIKDFKDSQFTLNEPTTIVLMILYVPIFLTSLIGNVIVLLVIVPNQRMWTVTNNFLVNLAVADLLVTVLCMPMTVAGKVYKLWVYGDVLCKMTPYLQGVSVTASTFTITAMSLDRCLAILYPVKCRNLRTKTNVRSLIAIIWITASLLMIPLLVVNKTRSPEIFTNFKITTCAEEWESVTQRRAYDFTLLFIVCLIPAQIVFISYLLMGKRLWVTDSRLTAGSTNKTINTRGSDRNSVNTVRATRRRTAKMCIVVSVVFVVCWLPHYSVNIYLDFKGDQDLLDSVYWGLFIGHLHCITNPILYCFMHKTFRYCVKRMLPCWKNALTRTNSAYGTTAYSRTRMESMHSSRSHVGSFNRSLTSSGHQLISQRSGGDSNSNIHSDDHEQSLHLLVPDESRNNNTDRKKVRLILNGSHEETVINNVNQMDNIKVEDIPVIQMTEDSYSDIE